MSERQLSKDNRSNLSDKNFLKKLKHMYGIQNVYYPGSWDDFKTLNTAFNRDQVIYLDFEVPEGSSKLKKVNFVQGDCQTPPFRDNTFDAAFVQDMHAMQEEFNGIVDVLKPGGLMIFSSYECYLREGIGLAELRQDVRLEEVELPFTHTYYTVFRKIDSENSLS